MPRLRALLPLAAAALAGCGNYAHDNPVDPGYAITVSLQGPDTITALGDTITLHVSTDRQWTGPAAQFTTDNPYVAYHVGTDQGWIVAHFPGQTVATVHLGAHEASTTVYVMQVPVAATIARCDSGSLAVTTLAPFGLCVNAVDRRGHPIAFYFSGSVPVVRVRDTTVLSLDSASLKATPRRNGSTWVVLTDPPLVDSALVTVQQVPAWLRLTTDTMTVAPPTHIQLPLGATVHFFAELVDSAGYRARVESTTVGSNHPTALTVNTSGIATVLAAGASLLRAAAGGDTASDTVYTSGGSAPWAANTAAGFTVDSAGTRGFVVLQADAVDPDWDLTGDTVYASSGWSPRPITPLLFRQTQPADALLWSAGTAPPSSVLIALHDHSPHLNYASVAVDGTAGTRGPAIDSLVMQVVDTGHVRVTFHATAPAVNVTSGWVLVGDPAVEPSYVGRFTVAPQSTAGFSMSFVAAMPFVSHASRMGIVLRDSTGGLSRVWLVRPS